MNVLVIYGSLYSASRNRSLARALQELAPDGMNITLRGVDMPLFSEDVEAKGFPQEAIEQNEAIRTADGIIIVTPEYNRTMPGSLKNALDWASRPDGNHPWPGKPTAVLGASTGARGASFAQYDVRKVLGYFNTHVMGQPEVYVGNFDAKVNESGAFTDEKTREVLRKFLAAFKAHVEKLS